jgi:Skp family chaperone for outer membrane proteins
VKMSRLVAALAASVASLGLIAAAAAQVPARAPGTGSVALVDVNYIFKNHVRFKAMIDEMKADFDRTQAEFKRQGDAINKLSERLNEYRPGTPDYKAMEEEIVNQRSKFQGQVALQKKEFLQREAKIYYNVYTEIMQEVQYLAAANNISMVLTFNGDPINPEKPDDVLRGINNPVVYYDKSLDITPSILKRLGAKPASAGGPMGVGTGAPTRPNPAAGGIATPTIGGAYK